MVSYRNLALRQAAREAVLKKLEAIERREDEEKTNAKLKIKDGAIAYVRAQFENGRTEGGSQHMDMDMGMDVLWCSSMFCVTLCLCYVVCFVCSMFDSHVLTWFIPFLVLAAHAQQQQWLETAIKFLSTPDDVDIIKAYDVER